MKLGGDKTGNQGEKGQETRERQEMKQGGDRTGKKGEIGQETREKQINRKLGGDWKGNYRERQDTK